ncbi:MAG TPA: hypothetical protein VFG42_22460 [Baekduia sp.]|uniref:hypothetical protein n=1 Tax=Baekduia sp. TaxID=2600305 RepID=UPI002D765AD1|nr:hypothetical protein [Baekduia sp.]HET6509577.1 hypothetical protein [Baekduia sp.]
MFSIEWKRQVEDDMASGERMQSLHDMLIQLRDPAYVASAAIVPAITQRWGHRGYDWYDAAAVDEVAFLAKVGLLAIAWVPVGAVPGKDREQRLNQERLDAIASPFGATFLGGAGDSDGTLGWDSPIELIHQQGDGTELHLKYEPTSIPLEVGHVAPETVPWHIRYEGGVARWPYRSESIALILTTRRYPGRAAGSALYPDIISGRRVADEGFPLDAG